MRFATGTPVRVVVAAGAAAILALATPVMADVDVDFVHEGLYQYRVTHVPDHDQVRAGLVANGTVHCVPTSSINWMCYFANHGHPAIGPGPGYWQFPALYDTATQAIDLMGLVMLTEPPHGTYGSWATLGIRAWMFDWPVVVWRMHIDDNWCPRAHDAALFGMSGSYVLVGVGWYLEAGDTVLRDGGHSLSLVHAARDGGLMQIGWRDPGSHEGNLHAQSPFATEKYMVEDRVVLPLVPYYDGYKVMSRVSGYGGGGKNAYIDSITMIVPGFVLTTLPDLLHFKMHYAMVLDGADIDPEKVFALPEGASLIDMAIHPDMKAVALVQMQDAAKLCSIDFMTGGIIIDDMPWNAPTKLMVNRRRAVYVLDQNDLVMVDADLDPPQEVQRRPLPGPPSALAYDDIGDDVWVLCAEDRQVHRFIHDLVDPVFDTFDLPPEVVLGEQPSMCWNWYDESAWIVSEASNSLWRLTEVRFTGELVAEEITHPSLVAPLANIQTADFGRLVFTSAGEVREFVSDGAQAQSWHPAENPWFPGETSAGPVATAVSMTNYQHFEHGIEEFRDVLPNQFGDPEIDCDADVNKSGAVDVGDLVAVILAWDLTGHNGFIDEDVDQNGIVDVQDLVAIILAWGPCP